MPDSAPLEPGDPAVLGRYTVVGRIGAGGQGAVYLGRSPDGTHVAIKLLHEQMNADSSARARFAREVEAAQKVSPFCTARVLDAQLEGRQPYVVSEFIDGPPLFDMVLADGVFTGVDLERLAIGTATALAAIHEAGIVHRDFKPNNVIIAPDGPRVIDFGIARSLDSNQSGVTATGMVVGTPGYLAPEQLSGEPLTPSVDIFAWGATMVFAATGRSPFEAETLPVIINRILNEQPDLSALHGPLRGLVGAALDKNAARRPAAHQLLLRLLGNAGAAPSPHANQAEILEEGTQLASQLPGPTMAPRARPMTPNPGPMTPQRPMTPNPVYQPNQPRMQTPNPSMTPPPWQQAQAQPTPPPWQQGPMTRPAPYQAPPQRGRSKNAPIYIALGIGAALLLVIGVPIAIFVGTYHKIKHDISTYTPPAYNYGVPSAFAGTWNGNASQTGPAQTYTVSIALQANSLSGTVNYGNGACTGDLFENAESSTSTVLSFNQILSYNPKGTCPATGTVTLTQSNSSTLAFKLTDSGPTGTGTLTKQ
jgi:serine/threonine protein kinase